MTPEASARLDRHDAPGDVDADGGTHKADDAGDAAAARFAANASGGAVFGRRSGGGRGRTIRIRLTDSPISQAGYWFGTAVGAAWGFLLSTGRIETRRGMLVFRGMPTWAFGRGGACVGGTYLTKQNVNDRVLRHEAVHREQWRKYGMLFPLLYLLAGRDPLRNRFEIEAGLEDGGYLPRRPAG